MSKHTPGPWKPHQISRYWLVKTENISGYIVAEVGPIEGCAEANARLIAAAPDLLAALKEAEFVMDDCPLWSPHSLEAIFMARAAIIKATVGEK